MLRSCYSAKWRFPGIVGDVPGYFYFNDNAPDYPGMTFFGSANWHRGDGSPWPQYGEIENTARPWRDGSFADPPLPLPMVLGPVAQVEGEAPMGLETWPLVDGVPFPCFAPVPPPLPPIAWAGCPSVEQLLKVIIFAPGHGFDLFEIPIDWDGVKYSGSATHPTCGLVTCLWREVSPGLIRMRVTVPLFNPAIDAGLIPNCGPPATFGIGATIPVDLCTGAFVAPYIFGVGVVPR